MTKQAWNTDKGARRKTFILAVAVALALLWLLTTTGPVQPPVVSQ